MNDIAYLMPKFKYSLYLNKGCKIFSKDNLYPLENCHKEDKFYSSRWERRDISRSIYREWYDKLIYVGLWYK